MPPEFVEIIDFLLGVVSSIRNGITFWVSTFKDLATAIAAIIAAYVAIKGLNTWQHQLKGTAKFDLARKVLVETYTLRDAINNLRRPIKPEKERLAALQEEGIELDQSDPGYDEFTQELVVNKRWRRVEDTLPRFHRVTAEAEVLLKEEVKENLDAISGSVTSLEASIFVYNIIPDKDSLVGVGKQSLDTIYWEIFGYRDEKDRFNKELEGRIQNLEVGLEEYGTRKVSH
jgi:hypothetical protein